MINFIRNSIINNVKYMFEKMYMNTFLNIEYFFNTFN